MNQDKQTAFLNMVKIAQQQGAGAVKIENQKIYIDPGFLSESKKARVKTGFETAIKKEVVFL